ncbi:MAG: sigma-54 dependent transcriptional regulator [Candidatus Tritonobacter lacicola]|nr:sigma-54 dependent transcriptional regulator [Candidatus Tritonobacter lacicola]
MKILVIDDDRRVRQYLFDSLSVLGHEVCDAGAGEEGVELFRKESPDLVVVDLKMEGLDGMGVIEKIKALDPAADIVMMTAYASVETAVEAIRRGAVDYITKPFDAAQIDMIAKNVREKKLLEAAPPSGTRVDGIIGDSGAIRRVHELIHKVAKSEVTVLIQGESGTGKELVARAIHGGSARAGGPFVAIDCGALSESLLESELFGHKKGAFTGADEERVGLIRSADGGTVFLDEVANLGLGLQAKFLRLLEDMRVRPVGGDDFYPVDVRVIAATNRNLRWDVEEGRFRKDLYYRLDVVSIHVPPLRERPGDIALLIDHFLISTRREKKFNGEALKLLLVYGWPGNVRELENVIEHACTVSTGGVMGLEDIPDRIKGTCSAEILDYRSARKGALADFDRKFIEDVLKKEGGDVTRAAIEMGISSRALYEKLKNLGMSSKDFK